MASETHTERALVTLRQRILNGTYTGGARLFEVALAEDLAISRTPVRAALSKLAEEGLLDRNAAGGFRVRTFRMEDVLDTIELRGTLEGMAARLAAERGAPASALRAAAEILRNIDRILSSEDMDMDAYSKANSAFHAHLAQMAGSRVVEREIARVTALPFASPSAFVEDDSHAARLRQTLHVAQAQHRGIIDAIEARESARAEFLTREHARLARHNVKALTSDAAALREGIAPLAIMRP